MESQDFGHEHPLVFNEEQSNQSEASPTHDEYCSRCGGEILSGPTFSCSESECGFYLHKECAQAPSQINHPFHCNHPLSLLPTPPAKYSSRKFLCSFCGEEGEMFDYSCSLCDIDLHIKCALFTCNLADKKVGELKLIASRDVPISSTRENGDEEVASAKCFGCWEQLADSVYSLDRGINLHQKCTELASEINDPGHHKHPLIPQLSGSFFSCVICFDTKKVGFCYFCSLCNFGIHIACLSPPSVIKKRDHPHPFTLFKRQFTFTCDACGEEGNCVPYMCSTCNLLVHKKCISLPSLIHEHSVVRFF